MQYMCHTRCSDARVTASGGNLSHKGALKKEGKVGGGFYIFCMGRVVVWWKAVLGEMLDGCEEEEEEEGKEEKEEGGMIVYMQIKN